MRWWLALAFAAVAATTAIAVAELSSRSSEAELRERAQELAAGNAFSAAIELRDDELERVAQRRRLALFLFNDSGALISSPRSHGVALGSILPAASESVDVALSGRRSVTTADDIGATFVALPFVSEDADVLLAYASHPDLAAELGIVRDEITSAAWTALLVGGLVGVVIASLIARRLRRIARAAAAMEAGDLETPLARDFPDEVGDLAVTFDRMRLQLRSSFQRLEAERDRLELLFERLHEAVVAVDATLVVRFANRAARELLGPIDAGATLPDPWDAVDLRAVARRLHQGDRVDGVHAHADDRVLAIDGIPSTTDDLAIVVIRDVTEDERRERAEREFVANASHELRTPLTTILGAVEVLQEGAKDDPALRDRFLAHIERESQRLVRLTRALLVLARAQDRETLPRLVLVRLRPLLDEVASSIHPRPGVSARVECADDIFVAAEPDLLEQALMNLAVNAVEHTSSGQIIISAHGNGNGRIAIDVRDSGGGIGAGLRERIFDRFYRPDQKSGAGFGLGLAIARDAVRAQGGTIDVRSRPGEGTTFTIELERAWV